MTNNTPDYLLLGEILRPHGIRGEMRMRVLTDYPERITELDYVYIGTGPESRKIKKYDVEHMRMHKGYGLLKLKSINGRDEAEFMRSLFVMVSIQDAIPLDDDEIYLFQLIGMTIQTEDGTALGTIADVLETGANDVYIVNSPKHGEILIPVTDETILKTDDENRTITVKLPDGHIPNL